MYKATILIVCLLADGIDVQVEFAPLTPPTAPAKAPPKFTVNMPFDHTATADEVQSTVRSKLTEINAAAASLLPLNGMVFTTAA